MTLANRRATVATLVVVGVAAAASAVYAGGGTGTTALPGLPVAGPVTAWGLPVARVLADVSAAATLGLLVAAACLAPVERERARLALSATGFHAVRLASLAATGWLLAVAALAVFTVSDLLATPAVEVLRGRATVSFLLDLVQGRALLVSASAAVVTAVVARFALEVRTVVPLAAVAVAGLAAPAFAGHAASSGDHQLAVSSLVLHSVAAAAWVGGLTALLLLRHRGTADRHRAVRRFSVLATWCLPLVVAAGALNATTRLQHPAELWNSTYGQLLTVKIAAVAVVVVLAAWHRRFSVPALADGRPGTFRRIAVVEVAVLAAASGLAVALSRTPPPTGDSGEETIAQTLLGFPMPGPLSAGRLLTQWLVEPLAVTVAVVAVGSYLAGWWRLRRRGVTWPVHRLVVWTAGWAVVVLVTGSGLARYAPVLFSAHMVVHMALSMLAPILLVLGAPVTLALRALRPTRASDWPGPREWLTAALHSRPAVLLSHPLVALAVYVGSLYGLYFTGLFELALRSHAAHLAMQAHFLTAGYLFFHALIGVDPGRRPAPYPLRMLLLFAAMALHAIFGLAIQQSTTVLAADWYTAIARPWGASPLQDQRLGGGIAWSFGELPTALVAIILLAQWWRADQREARRVDRAIDRAEADGEDHALAAYNRQLAAWAAGSRRTSQDATDEGASRR
ncbi:cytochrome c oxidase assembly protein [Dactylosporangium siamense]|uniref:Copper resistance protein D n=1 Tax=Dactylosporangium siamense TaxID=685454 RepID=A0A919PM15_9ACTN|nr:cytochrome c oxidase assembly protein [Dactylosporangium siamense]GIG47265.1 copper resistance protein D [Dactylosporangium siamense]